MTKKYTGYDGESFTEEDAKALRAGLYGTTPTPTTTCDNHEASTSATADGKEPAEETSS